MSAIKIALMGDRNAGRTSISRVLFQTTAPSNQMIFPQTTILQCVSFNISQIEFNLYDFPSRKSIEQNTEEEKSIIGSADAVVYVINPQGDHLASLNHFVQIYEYCAGYGSQHCQFFIFINKMDISLMSSQDQDELLGRQKGKLAAEKIELSRVSFHFTSIMDFSINQAFSRVVQKILPCTPSLCRLLNRMSGLSKIAKIFVYDIVTKLVIAHNDEVPVNPLRSQICSSIIDFYVDFNWQVDDNSQDSPSHSNRVQIKIFPSHESREKEVFVMEQTSHALSLCYIIKQSNYDRPYLIGENIRVVQKGVLSILEETWKHFKYE